MPRSPHAAALLALTTTLACSGGPSCADAARTPAPTRPVEDTRGQWLRQVLLDDNRNLLEREPQLTTGKFRKMASTPYNYYRGTANVFLRDASESGGAEAPTAYGSADASHVLLVGDPHPENIGSYRDARGQMVLDFNDFDGSTFGSYHLDVRRLAAGFLLIAHLAGPALSDGERDAIPGLLARTYVEEMRAIGAGAPGLKLEVAPTGDRSTLGAILGDLVRRAVRDGDIREELDEYTILKDGRRAIRFGEVEASEVAGLYRDTVHEVPATQAQTVREMLLSYPATLTDANPLKSKPDAFTIKGMSKRLGAGVSSYPVRRYYVLIEGATSSPEDDVLLEFKEILEAWRSPRLPAFKHRRYRSDAERVVVHQRALQTTPDNDVWLGWTAKGPFSLRVRERSKYQKGVDAERILEGLADRELGSADLNLLVEHAARLLARAHGTAKTIEGKDGAAVILAALGEDTDGFVGEVSRASQAGLGRLLDDYERFLDSLELHGPYLGYRFITPPEGQRTLRETLP